MLVCEKTCSQGVYLLIVTLNVKSWITVNTFIKHLAQPGLHIIIRPEISVAHPDLFHLSSNYFKYEILIFEMPLESGDSYLTINNRGALYSVSIA